MIAPRASHAPAERELAPADPAGALQAELLELSAEARERRSVDLFARAALEGFAWAVVAGICGKLVWDSSRPPLFLWPLAFFDLLLLADAASRFVRGRAELRREVAVLARVRALRIELGIDPAADRPDLLPSLGREPAGQP